MQPYRNPCGSLLLLLGAVGGAAALCLLIVAFWLYKRSKRNKAKQSGGIIGASKLGKPAKPGKAGKPTKNAGVVPLLSDGLASPSPHTEKQGFNVAHPNQPVSYVSSSPPASSYNPPSSYNPGSPPPGAAAAFNPHTLSYTQGTHSPPPSSTAGTMPLPNSPHTMARPMSTVSSTSGAQTMSYYNPGPESAGFAGYAPHPQQQQQQQAAPVWATPEPSTSPAPMHVQQPSVPSPSVSPAPTATHYTPATPHIPMTPPPEKAQYMARPEKAGFSGSNAGGSSNAGGPSTTGASSSGSGYAQHDAIMSPAVPDLPPPAYQ